ncbi:MAG: acetate--CoA ligase, partial [Burkholderiales bacterium]
ADLQRDVSKAANALLELGVRTGDRVAIYMPMIPELPIAMLACARIGAPHTVVFGGFSAEALSDRINDAEAVAVITADGGWRRGKPAALKPAVDDALATSPSVRHTIVVRRLGDAVEGGTAMTDGRDMWWHDIVGRQSEHHDPVPVDSEHMLYLLYTSGTTAKPKGIIHTTGGYLVGTGYTHEMIFDVKPDDVYWCAADVGWVTGHSYIVYGPLANATTSVLYEGTPDSPDWGRWWQIIEDFKVSILYCAPTAIRAHMKQGPQYAAGHDLSSLRVLGTVGEPINPEAWLWYWRVVGDERCPIVDTWWQTETGGIMITTLPGAHVMKPGSAGMPFFGVVPQLVDGHGHELEGAASGNLCLVRSWPGQMRTVYGDHDRFVQTYFTHFKGKYFTGDGCRRDGDDYYWITGRVDDVINVSGHRIGTAEVESALVAHPLVAEAAVVGYPHDIKGQGIYCYVTLIADAEITDSLVPELKQQVRTEIGPIATPDRIHFTPALPKTRSGKIMRRILRKIAENDFSS